MSSELPFSKLPIDIELFQTEIAFSLLGIACIVGIMSYIWIRNSEQNLTKATIPDGENTDTSEQNNNSRSQTKIQTRESKIQHILSLLNSDNWLDDSVSEKWNEEIIEIIEETYSVKIPRNGDYTNLEPLGNTWINLLASIQYIRYKPNRTEEENERTRGRIQNTLSNFALGNSSFQ